MSTYRRGGDSIRPRWYADVQRRGSNALGLRRASSNIPRKATGGPDPGRCGGGVLTPKHGRGRDTRIANERGAVLPMMALMLVVLMGSAAMAVDLGWLFWQSIEIQHGADAAALAGVIYEPDQRADAHTQGTAAAVQNGFVHDPLNGNAIEIIDFVDDPTAVEQSSQLRAIVTRRVPTFFMRVFGLETVDISRTALM